MPAQRNQRSTRPAATRGAAYRPVELSIGTDSRTAR
jgi:hypothetical protein